tara:strand:+ start:8006 stop:8851 length:846 start_codon:yes stop_codon:yes gene_type:complete
MANTTISTSAVNKKAMLADAVLASMERQLVWENTVDSSFSDMVKGGGGQVLTVPKATTPSAGSKSAGSDVTYGADTHGSFTITVDQHKYVAKQIETSSQVWTQPSMFAMETNQFGYALAKAVDDYIEGVAEADTGSISDLGADNTFTSALIRTGMTSLMGADVPFDGNVFLTVNPASYASLLAIEDFVDSSKYGNSAPVQTGVIGKLYGIEIRSSNSISGVADADEAGYLYHRSAIAFARAMDVKVEMDYSVSALADQVVAHTIYGGALAFADRLYEYHNI